MPPTLTPQPTFTATFAPSPTAEPATHTPLPGNTPPTIQRVWAVSTTVQAGDSVTVTCRASDADQDVLHYTWSALAGEFADAESHEDGASVVYRAPDQAGMHWIVVTVNDGRGEQVQAATEIEVTPREPPPNRYWPGSVFAPVWSAQREVQERLGWAREPQELVTHAAQQPFERGLAFWQRDLLKVHVLETDGRYGVFESTWEEREGDYSCPQVAESRTPPTPRRHIGQVWCDELGGPGAAIGAALADQQDYDTRWQPFEGGMMWLGLDGRVYAFYEDGDWSVFAGQ